MQFWIQRFNNRFRRYLYSVHFLDWMLERQDEPDNLGLLARVMWQDINNGCGGRYTDPIEWRIHFNKKHPRTAERLNAMLSSSYVVYAETFNAEI